MGLRYAYNTNGLANHRLNDAVDLLADTGYDGVALTLDVAHLDPFGPELARETLAAFGDRVTLVHADYRELPAVLAAAGVGHVMGVLLDLGVSSMQLDEEGRGFSFRRDEPLDMRMDRSQGQTLAERLVDVEETALADVIFQFGEERKSRRVARASRSGRTWRAGTAWGLARRRSSHRSAPPAAWSARGRIRPSRCRPAPSRADLGRWLPPPDRQRGRRGECRRARSGSARQRWHRCR